MKKWFYTPVLMLVVFMTAQRASAASSALLQGETPSDKAQQITGRGNNWRNPAMHMRVYNPRTGQNYAEAQFRSLPVGTVVEFPDEFAIARPIQITEKGINQICADYIIDAATASCADRLIRRHRLASIVPGITPDTAITRELWVPIVWQVRAAPPVPQVETPAPVVQTPGLWTRVRDWFTQNLLVSALVLGLLILLGLAYWLRDRFAWMPKFRWRNPKISIYEGSIDTPLSEKYETPETRQERLEYSGSPPPPPTETPPEREHRPTHTPFAED